MTMLKTINPVVVHKNKFEALADEDGGEEIEQLNVFINHKIQEMVEVETSDSEDFCVGMNEDEGIKERSGKKVKAKEEWSEPSVPGSFFHVKRAPRT